MDPDLPSSTPRKVRFAPRAPPRRKAKPVAAKTEVDDENDDDADGAQALLSRANDRLRRRGPKVEKKSSVQVAFAHGAAASTSIRTYGKPREGNADQSSGFGLKYSARDDGQIIISPPATTGTEGTSESSVNAVDTSSLKIRKEYREPWDYHRTNYPITLPLRRPYSGDPELLDEAEFGEAVANMEYDENITNSASELGLLEENDKAQMLFLQLPPNLPLVKRGENAKGKNKAGSSMSLGGTVASAMAKGKEKVGSLMASREANVPPSAKGKEMISSSISSGKGNALTKGCSLEELPGGYMGKMLVYKSGAIKLKLGETLYDVSPGSNCIFAEDVVAINTVDQDCCMLGELGKRAVVTPDVDSLLDDVIDLS